MLTPNLGPTNWKLGLTANREKDWWDDWEDDEAWEDDSVWERDDFDEDGGDEEDPDEETRGVIRCSP